MFIGGNWKLNGDKKTLLSLAQAIADKTADVSQRKIVLFPPFVYVNEIVDSLANSAIKVGAQNQADQESGAFTGEVAASMLHDVGCEYVLLGHSERRHVYGETHEMINKKMHLAFANNLIPVLCVGETLDERKQGNAEELVLQQLTSAFSGLSDQQIAQTVIAYEPVWAIGTGEVATPEQAQAMHATIRDYLKTVIVDKAQAVDIIYGGSVKAANAKEIFAMPDVDGGLIGGASLKADEFAAICKA